MVVCADRLTINRCKPYPHRVLPDRPIPVGPGNYPVQGRRHAELFEDLPDTSGLRVFTIFDFATGQLPFPCKVCRIGALCGKEPAGLLQ